jgi:ornithine cyclodeaminase/alanine dehydrogenase-like protein (mu-crystallin family)
MIFLNRDQINDLISMEEAIRAMKTAFAQLSSGEAVVPPRLSLDIPDKNATSLVMPAYATGSPYYTVKIVSVNYSNPDKGLPLIHGIVQVFDAENGKHIANLDGASITAIRTGAASGLATDLLAKENANVCAVFGTGVQAASHIEAVLAVRPIEKIIVFSRSKPSAEKFCSTLANQVQCEIGKKESLLEADIVCTTTPASSPLFETDEIKPGCHLNVVGSHQPSFREVPTGLVARSKIIVDKREACEQEAGDLIIPVQEGSWSFEHLHGELGQVVSGDIIARESENEITLFKSVGNAIQDHAMAHLIMEKLN